LENIRQQARYIVSSQQQWFIRRQGRVQGPFPPEKLQDFAQRGQLARIHEVSMDQQSWRKAGEEAWIFQPQITEAPAPQSRAPVQIAPVQPQQPQPGFAAPQPQPGGAAPPVSDAWFFQSNGRQQGPIDFATLSRMLSVGDLDPNTMVWREGMPQWQPATMIPGLIRPKAPSSEPAAKQRDEVSEKVISPLLGSKPWIMFLAILGFIKAAGTLALAVTLIAMSVPHAGPYAIFLVIVSALVMYGSSMLLQHTNMVAELRRSASEKDLTAALKHMAHFWIYIGILTIVVIVANAFLIILLLSVPSFRNEFR
jgi:hypothetical protein